MKYCNNRSSQGEFIGNMCYPCFTAMIIQDLKDSAFHAEMALANLSIKNNDKYCKILDEFINKIDKIIKEIE